MNSAFHSSMEPFAFYKSLLVGICEGDSESSYSVRGPIKPCSCISRALDVSPQAFMYVSSHWCPSTATVET